MSQDMSLSRKYSTEAPEKNVCSALGGWRVICQN